MFAVPPPPTLWRALFGDDRPVEVEIGPGRGDVILAYAAAARDRGFVGIEWRGRSAALIAERADALGATNVRVVAGDARWILTHVIPSTSVAAYHIYFPDPWPKTRHRGRRLFEPALVDELRRTLVPGGAVHVASDLPALVADATARLAAGGLARCPGATLPTNRPTTRFERKYARAGTHYVRFERP